METIKSSPFEGRYNLHVSPNCTLNLSTKQSFDKACVKEENRTRKVRSIFRKHFLPKLNVIKIIVFLRSFKEMHSFAYISPSYPHVRGVSCIALNLWHLSMDSVEGGRRDQDVGATWISCQIPAPPLHVTLKKLLKLSPSVPVYKMAITSCINIICISMY